MKQWSGQWILRKNSGPLALHTAERRITSSFTKSISENFAGKVHWQVHCALSINAWSAAYSDLTSTLSSFLVVNATNLWAFEFDTKSVWGNVSPHTKIHISHWNDCILHVRKMWPHSRPTTFLTLQIFHLSFVYLQFLSVLTFCFDCLRPWCTKVMNS